MMWRIVQLIDFYRFEETFRIDHHRSKAMDSDDHVDNYAGGGDTLRRMSRHEAVSLLEQNRSRNVGQLPSVFCLLVGR